MATTTPPKVDKSDDSTSDTSSAKPQVVTAPLVMVKDQSGVPRYVYRGQPVDGYDPDDVARLVDLGLVGDAADDIVPGVAALPY